ncbi:Beta-barrel assembly-enhancing protease [bacterium HR40]|nr:Beta-barrel assembly-enhancing protease [bacterium HR40]
MVARSLRLWSLLLLLVALVGRVGAADELPTVAEIRALRDAGKLEEALAAVRRARELAPSDADLALFEGQLLFFRGEHGAAERVLRAALALAPDYPDVRLALARTLAAQGRSREALALLSPLEGEGSPEVLLLLARLALAVGDGGRAERVLARARTLAPDDPGILLAEGDRLLAAGRIDLARPLFERVAGASGEEAEVARTRLAELAAENPFTLTLAASESQLRGGAGTSWRDVGLELAWRWNPRTVLHVGLGDRHRWGRHDSVIAVGFDHRLGETTLATRLQLTPRSDFSPQIELRLGLERPLVARRGTLATTAGRADLRLARHPSGTLSGLALGLVQYWADGRMWTTLAAGLDRDEAGRIHPALSARFDIGLGDRLRLFAGSALAREGTADGTVAERTLFAGFVLALSADVELFADLARVRREDLPDRRALGLAIRIRF